MLTMLRRAGENSGRRPWRRLAGACLGGFLLAAALARPAAALEPRHEVPQEEALRKGCLSCHEGIEDINEKMTKAGVVCVTCHFGNPSGTTAQTAHKNMLPDPGDYKIVEQTCGQCHGRSGSVTDLTLNGEHDHVGRGLRSRMATAAGEINTLRYLWGAQESPAPRYGTRGVRALPKATKATGATKASGDAGTPASDQDAGPEELLELPGAGASHADALLRRACLSCHLWSGGEASFGRYRGSGCTACHVPYADDGRSRSGDPTLDREKPGHPERHTITVRVPTSQCLHCHRNAGLHLGPSFTGRLEARAAAPLGEPGDRPGSRLLRLQPDVHFERGLGCIDCHPSRQLHGDGSLGRAAEPAVRCQTCHGSPTAPPTLRDRWGNALTNLTAVGEEVYLQGKLSRRRHRVPNVYALAQRGELPVAMRLPGHLGLTPGGGDPKVARHELECYACHARTAPQYYGFFVERDDRSPARWDWVGNAELPGWIGRFLSDYLYLRWETPPLGLNALGRVAPFVPLYQTFFSHRDRQGATRASGQVFKTAAGLPGLAMRPVQPHSITRLARDCTDCHSSGKALGLGDGYQEAAPGARVPPPISQGPSAYGDRSLYLAGTSPTPASEQPPADPPLRLPPLDKLVDQTGKQLLDLVPSGARPFQRDEIDRLLMVSDCAACHGDGLSPAPPSLSTEAGGSFSTRHRQSIERLFERALGAPAANAQ